MLDSNPMEAKDKRTVYATLLMLIAQIEDKAALQLFNICAYFEPTDIPLQIFINGRENLPHPLCDMLDLPNPDLNTAFSVLKRNSLVKFNEAEGDISKVTLSIHNLTQTVARIHHGLGNPENGLQWLRYAISLLAHTFSAEKTIDVISFFLSLPHVQSVASIAEEVSEENDDILDSLVHLHTSVGFALYNYGIYSKALEWFLKSLPICEKALGHNDSKVVEVYLHIALSYEKLGYYNDALTWQHKVLCIQEKMEEKDCLAIVDAYNDIGRLSKILGRDFESLEYHQMALGLIEKTNANEYGRKASTYDLIARAQGGLGNYNTAIEFYQKALCIIEKEGITEHNDIAVIYGNMSIIYNNLHDHNKALELGQKALSIHEQALTHENSVTAFCYNAVGATHNELGDSFMALTMLRKAVRIFEKIGGSDSDASEVYRNYGHAFLKNGNTDNALKWFDKAVEHDIKLFGHEHPSLASRYNSIATVYNEMNYDVYVLEYLQKAFNIMLSYEEHPALAIYSGNIATVYSSQHNYAKALDYYLISYRILIKRHGESHMETIHTLDSMKKAYIKTNQPQPFEEWLQQNLYATI